MFKGNAFTNIREKWLGMFTPIDTNGEHTAYDLDITGYNSVRITWIFGLLVSLTPATTVSISLKLQHARNDGFGNPAEWAEVEADDIIGPRGDPPNENSQYEIVLGIYKQLRYVDADNTLADQDWSSYPVCYKGDRQFLRPSLILGARTGGSFYTMCFASLMHAHAGAGTERYQYQEVNAQ